MHPALRIALRTATLLWALALLIGLATLAGCGGNGSEEDDCPPAPGHAASAPSPNCTLHPEQCI